ncbi:MAG: hypothetical protein ACOC1W_04905 [Bacillota bacterium]
MDSKYKNRAVIITIVLFLAVVIFTMPVLAEEDDDLEWRTELIQASREMMNEDENSTFKNHKLGSVFTTYGEGDNQINAGLRFAPQLGSPGEMPVRFIGEIFYLRSESEFAGFMSLAFEPVNNIYFGAGSDVIGEAEYHLFAGWDITDNIFVEARAINTGGSFEDSDLHPVAGFQITF